MRERVRAPEQDKTGPSGRGVPRPSRSSSGLAGALLNVQRHGGNRAATALVVQAKLTVGRDSDPHERDADAVADQIMRMVKAPTGPGLEPTGEAQAAQTVHRKTHGGRDPLGGLPVDGGAEAEIDRARGGGRPVADDVRRAAEAATGADLSRVRVHDDDRSHQLSRSLQARAFTTGSDIFFGKDTYRPSSAAGNRLIAHELAHVVQQGGATARRSVGGDPRDQVQRVVTYGADPKAAIQQTDNDLLYGISSQRALTVARLDALQKTKLRTIDEYNKAIGINTVMRAQPGGPSPGAAMGLYTVRAELASNAAWGLTLDPALNTAANSANIQAWITLLRQNAAHIGLEDLGQKGGVFSKAKIEQKHRFKKNRKESQASNPTADRLTPTDTRKFLSPANNQAAAQHLYNAMSAPKQAALNEWVYRAFFRRTSKLGQDFVIGLGGNVHFNTRADPEWDPNLRIGSAGGPRDHGLKTMSKKGETDKNRSITVSEYRHMKKRVKKNNALAPNYRVYGE